MDFSILKNKEHRSILAAVVLAALLILAHRVWGPVKGPYIAPLAQGRQTYFVSTKGPGPKISQVVVDPFDPKPGEMQTISVQAHDASLVTVATVTMLGDRKQTTYPLVLASGTSVDGEWHGSWSVPDTHDFIYRAIVAFESKSGRTNVELSFR